MGVKEAIDYNYKIALKLIEHRLLPHQPDDFIIKEIDKVFKTL